MTMKLIRQIDAVLRRTGISATRFGLLVARDPCLVGDMRKGRCPGPKLRAKILAALAELDA